MHYHVNSCSSYIYLFLQWIPFLGASLYAVFHNFHQMDLTITTAMRKIIRYFLGARAYLEVP